MAEYLVTSDADDWSAGTLRSVINTQAGSGDTIKFDAGISVITLAQGEIVLSKNLTISGPGADVLTISGNNATRVFNVSLGVIVNIEGLSVRSGSADNGSAIYNRGTLFVTESTLSGNTASGYNSVDSGGAIYNIGALTLTNSLISSNTALIFSGGVCNNGLLSIIGSRLSSNNAARGGGAISNTGTLIMTNSTLDNNSANWGGAIVNQNGTIEITNCELSGNGSNNDSGGAINMRDGTIHIRNSRLFSNSATGFGGGGGAIYIAAGTLHIESSRLFNNSSGGTGAAIENHGILIVTDSSLSSNKGYLGGALFSRDGESTIIKSTLSGNSAEGGGAISCNTGTVNLINCTVSNNTAQRRGGAINNTGTVNISFSTIAENTAPDGAGIYSGQRLMLKNSIIANLGDNMHAYNDVKEQGVNFTTNVVSQLKLGPLAVNAPGTTETHALLPGSIAIDTVTDFTDVNGNPVTTDQRGIYRPQNAAGDAGAYEAPMLTRGIPFSFDEK